MAQAGFFGEFGLVQTLFFPCTTDDIPYMLGISGELHLKKYAPKQIICQYAVWRIFFRKHALVGMHGVSAIGYFLKCRRAATLGIAAGKINSGGVLRWDVQAQNPRRPLDSRM
jgi:hypothetical protein